jgi:hypothetical protein
MEPFSLWAGSGVKRNKSFSLWVKNRERVQIKILFLMDEKQGKGANKNPFPYG